MLSVTGERLRSCEKLEAAVGHAYTSHHLSGLSMVVRSTPHSSLGFWNFYLFIYLFNFGVRDLAHMKQLKHKDNQNRDVNVFGISVNVV